MPSICTIHLLVVEDDPGYLFLIQDAFGARGKQTRWDVTTAKDGEEALRLLFEDKRESAPLPDLILLDWNLPRVTGAEVLRRVKQHRQLRKFRCSCFPPPKLTRILRLRTIVMPTGTSRSQAAAMLWRPSWKQSSGSGSRSPSFPGSCALQIRPLKRAASLSRSRAIPARGRGSGPRASL